MRRFDTLSDKILVSVIYLIVAFLVIITIYPFWDVLVLSVSPPAEAGKLGFRLFVKSIDFSAYRSILQSPNIVSGFYNSFVRVVVGTTISLTLVALTAYPLSKKTLPFCKQITAIIVFTMMFGGGLIPSYLLIKSLGLIDTIWALILPSAVTAYNLIIMRNFYYSIPESLEESATIDGCNQFLVWWRIVLPLSKPVLATVGLWISVAHWNAYFDALIYITDSSYYLLPVILRRMLMENQMDMLLGGVDTSGVTMQTTAETVKAAVIVVGVIPMLLLYPFLQKYFTKGVMLGAVKG